MSSEQNLAAWTAYGRHHIDRGTDVSDADRITWGFWPNGLGAEVLGDLSGKRVLDLASIGYTVDGVDFAEGALERARAEQASVEGVRWWCLDVEHDDLADLA